MADQDLLDVSQLSESQLSADDRLYILHDPLGTPQDLFVPLGELLGEFYKITPSVATNNLTLALKHLDGTDPSATKPLIFKIGDTWQIIDAAFSFTKNAGTSWCNLGATTLNTKNHDLFTYLIQESGASAGTKYGFSRIPYATTMADFVNTTTSEKYIAGSWTNFNATDPVVNIGRFRAQLSASAGFNWSIPSAKVINYPIFESDWLLWQPGFSASGSLTFTAAVTDLAEYRISGRDLKFEVKAHGTTGGTTSNTIILTSPFGATNGSQGLPMAAYVADPSTVIGGICSVGTSNLSITKYDNANWTLGINRYVAATGSYRIG
jgi:hypothetical protein